jgi:glycine cleavage system H protein
MPNPEQCRFAKTHEWVSLEGGIATVGVSDHAQHEITDVVFVELPKKGRAAKAAEAVAVVESVKAAFDIYAPISGEVVETNDAAVKEPALINASAQDKGWLFKLKAADPKELDALMTFAQYQEFLKQSAH